MKVMAFDIATRCGVAFGTAGGTPRATAVDLGKGFSDAERFAKVIGATRRLLERFEPDLVAFEEAVGGPKTSHFLVGIAACFQGQAAAMGYRPRPVPIATVRKHFLGKHLTAQHFPGLSKGRARLAIKRQVVARCTALGWEVKDDDEADACAIWDYACATWGRAQARPVGGLFDGN